jgi:quinol monooxygenase YgiN
MLIIAGFLRLDPAHRDAFVDAHVDLVRRARQTRGCLDLAITADPLEPDRVNNYECWESEDALASWRQIANAPELPAVEMRDVQVAKHYVDKTTSPFG